jgi:hypothetical protein
MGFRGSRVQIPPSRFKTMLNNDLRRPRPPLSFRVNLHHKRAWLSGVRARD